MNRLIACFKLLLPMPKRFKALLAYLCLLAGLASSSAALPDTLNLVISTDNANEVYLNGVLLGTANNWTKSSSYSAALQNGANVLAVKGVDAGGVAAMIAELTLPSGTVVSDTTWKVSATAPTGWETLGFNDSAWPAAKSYGQYGVAPWYKKVTGFPSASTAKWIWTADNNNDNTAYFRYAFTVGSTPLAVSTTSLADGVQGTAYSQTLGASGGAAPYGWSISAGTLPAGLSLNSTTGVLSGTPTVTGSSSFTVRTTDAGSATADRVLTLTIANAPPPQLNLVISTDNANEIYLNGVLLGTANNWTKSSSYSAALQSGANVLAVKGVDAGGVAALIADLTLPSGNVVSDTAWKVSATAPAGWETVGFNDSAWPAATSYGQYGVAPWYKKVAGFPSASTAKWIWTADNNNNNTAYFRYAFTVGSVTPPPAPPPVLLPPTDIVWVEDAVPAGGVLGGNEGWSFISANPAPFSGNLAHQSGLVTGDHQHTFYNATDKLSLGLDDTLFAYVYLDPSNPPSEVMLQWHEPSGWEHRAYWGANSIAYGVDGTVSRRYMGLLPAAGGWMRLEVPASDVGLAGVTIDGMAYTLFDGRATWDYAGKYTQAIWFAFTTTTLPAGVVGASYNQALAASGGYTPYTWSISAGALPAGISLNSATGVLSGTPTTAGTSNFTVQVQESHNRLTSKALSITVAQAQAGGIYYIYADHLNTPRVITNTANITVWRWDSDPFGTDVPNQNPSGLGTFSYNLRFPGQYWDKETGLHQNYFRDFDPATGRYVQSDPIGLAGGSFSTYGYANQNPLSFTDLFGLDPFGNGNSTTGPRIPGPPTEVFIPGTPANNAFVQSTNQAIQGIGNLIKSITKSALEECEQECDDKLDRDYAYCRALGGMYKDHRTRRACEEIAFSEYIQCRKKCKETCK